VTLVGVRVASAQETSVAQAETAPAVPPPPVITERKDDVGLWRPSVVQDGMLMALELETPAACGTPSVQWLDRRFRATPVGARFQVLLPVPLGVVRAAEPLVVRCGATSSRFVVPIVEGSYPESVLSVDPKFSQRAPARVQPEQAAINQAFKSSAPARLWQESFVRPATGIETSPFGVRRTFNGKIESRHRGVDFDGQEGEPIYAANDGVVTLVASDFYYTGTAVFIDHGDQLFTMYFHLSRVDVATGDKVTRGQLLGGIGKSGRVTGPHLHFAVKLSGSYVNPLDLLRLQPGLLLSELAITSR
jgi:murein DD-endopeptidase MepM/ murein hydrolase activator NlpD